MLKFYTSDILLINQSKEICEKQFSVFGSKGGKISPLMHVPLYTLCMLHCEVPRAWVLYEYRPVPSPCCLWVVRLSCHHSCWALPLRPRLSWQFIISPWSWWGVGLLPVLFDPLAGHLSWASLSSGWPVEWLAIVYYGCDVL